MGRNSACALSGLPIAHGDQVMECPLACEVNDSGEQVWLPSGFAVGGSYDEDAGRIDGRCIEPSSASKTWAKLYGFKPCKAWHGAFGNLKEPDHGLGDAFPPSWTAQGIALVRKDAWESILAMPCQLGYGSRAEFPNGLDERMAQVAGAESAEWIMAARMRKPKREQDYRKALGSATDPKAVKLLEETLASPMPISSSAHPAAPAFEAIFGSGARRGMDSSMGGPMQGCAMSKFWESMMGDAGCPAGKIKEAVVDMARFMGASIAMSSMRMAWQPSRPLGPSSVLGGRACCGMPSSARSARRRSPPWTRPCVRIDLGRSSPDSVEDVEPARTRKVQRAEGLHGLLGVGFGMDEGWGGAEQDHRPSNGSVARVEQAQQRGVALR